MGMLNESMVNVGDFQNDIAMMDAQLANLSSLCNNIQNNYSRINDTLDGSQEIYQNMNKIENKKCNEEQIGTMEAWALLQSIQQNLDSIDDEMNTMNNSVDHNNKGM